MKFIFIALLFTSLGSKPLLAQQARNTTQAIHFIKLANTLRELNKAPDAINLLLRALPTVRQTSLYWSAVNYELLGLSYKDQQDSAKAVYYLEIARARYQRMKYVASAWAVNELVRDISGKNYYAGIQIGMSSMKVAIFKTKYETDFYDKEIRTTFEVPTVTLFADASQSVKTGPDALKVCLDSIQRYNIPKERVFVVFSSELKAKTANTPEDRTRLYNRLSRDGSLQIDTTLTANREAELFTIGTIPRKVWPTTSALVIGSYDTKGGYFDSDTVGRTKVFHAVSLPIGINTLVSQIETKRSLGMDTYKKEAQRVVKAIADTTLKKAPLHRASGLSERKTVGLGGDIAWALVTYLHPEKAGVMAVPISLEDVERFKNLVLSDYAALSRPKIAASMDPMVRSKAEQDIRTLQSQVTEKQLIAGALWLEALIQHANATARKRFVFVRNSDIGWITGKFLETISGEYEQTIAKGEVYTK